MLDIVKGCLMISTDDFDTELESLIDDAEADLTMAGVTVDATDVYIQHTVAAYCKWHFGNPDNSARDEAVYKERKAQLMTATGYTTWPEA